MRTTIIALLCCGAAALPACAPEPADHPSDADDDLACAGEVRARGFGDGLPWDLALDRTPDPVCPADDPDCDRLDGFDVVDDDGTPIVGPDLAAPDGGAPARVAYGLTDPLATGGVYRAWPNGRVPYKLATDSSGKVQINGTSRTRLSQVMTAWEQLTEGRVKFRPATSADKAYVIVKRGSTLVRPFVGYRKDKVQELFLRDDEYVTVIRHELGHVLGLHHEQRRPDRTNHIQVRMQNVVDSAHCRYQFSTCADCARVGSYDRVSVMHYRTSDLAGCRNGPVLLKLDGTKISHVWNISAKDLDVIATMYGKTTSTPTTPTTPTTPEAPPLLPESGSLIGGGLCASVHGGADTEGTAIDARTCDGAGDQDWRFTDAGQLRVSHSLMCATVVGCSYAGAVVAQASCAHASLAQQWKLPEVSVVHGTTDKCLEAPAPTAGAALGFAPCSALPEQRFAYRPEREALELGGLCVTARDPAGPGTALILTPCDGRDTQRWFQGRGGFVTRANTALCMRASGDPERATGVELGACDDGVEQRWALRGTIRDARSNLCLHGSAMPGTPLSLAACDGDASQLWTFWSR